MFCYIKLKERGESILADETTEILESVIEYIETHLNQKLNQDTVAFAVGYSKYHLNRLFSNHLSMTIHQYIMRRRFTEAARLLVLSDKPIMQIAAQYGYGSSQAFSSAFKSVYKVSPAEYRKRSLFFPLQLRFSINRLIPSCRFTADDIEPIAWHG